MPAIGFLTIEEIDFEGSQPDLTRFMAEKESIQADREATIHFFQLVVYSMTMPKTLDILEAYSVLKSAAITCRMEGLIEAARYLEGRADISYNQLPKYAQW